MADYDWVRIGISMEEFTGSIEQGETRVLEVNGKDICMAHSNNGLFAVANKCPHAAGQLGQGWCDHAGNVVCPVHRWQFDLNTGRSSDDNGQYVEPYPLEEREDGLYLGFPRRKWLGIW